jgi:hypothetical protein
MPIRPFRSQARRFNGAMDTRRSGRKGDKLRYVIAMSAAVSFFINRCVAARDFSTERWPRDEAGGGDALRYVVATSPLRRFSDIFMTCSIRQLRRRSRRFNEATDTRRSGRGVIHCVVRAALQ